MTDYIVVWHDEEDPSPDLLKINEGNPYQIADIIADIRGVHKVSVLSEQYTIPTPLNHVLPYTPFENKYSAQDEPDVAAESPEEGMTFAEATALAKEPVTPDRYFHKAPDWHVHTGQLKQHSFTPGAVTANGKPCSPARCLVCGRAENVQNGTVHV